MIKRRVKVKSIIDDDEVFYLLPSGLQDTWILVNESPTELTVRHISTEQKEKFWHPDRVPDGPRQYEMCLETQP